MKGKSRKGSGSKKSSKESPKSESSRESGEYSSSPSTSPVLANVVGDIHLDRAVRNPVFFSQTSDVMSSYSQDSEMSFASGNQEFDEGLFLLDKSGSQDESTASVKVEEGEHSVERDRERSPPFDMSKVLTEIATPSPAVVKKSIPRMACFNCGGEHTLEKCDQKHDARKIARARAEYYNGKRSLSERYLDNNANSEFRAGRVSDELRAALGIGPRDLPEWIYRMRQKGLLDGYPPAYLKQAVDTQADKLLEFFTGDTPHASVAQRADDEKSGPPQINADKVIYYFGFNYYSRQYRDRERNFRVPDFKDFIHYHQVALEEKFEAEQRSKSRNKRKRSPPEGKKKKQRQAAKANDSEVELIELDTDSTDNDEICILPPPPIAPGLSSPATITTPKDGEKNGSAKRVMSCPDLTLGSSEKSTSGTPIGMRASQRSKPSLDKFGVGVVPFTHEPENTAHRGFFSNLMKRLKGAANQ